MDLDIGKYVEKDITFGECAELWWSTQKGLSINSIRAYQTVLKRLKPLNFIKIKDLKPAHLQNFYGRLYDEGVYCTIKISSEFIKKILDFAVNNNFATVNVANRTQIPRIPTRQNKRRSLTDEEKNAIFLAFDDFTPFEKVFVSILLYTGMRRGEILALTKEDINLTTQQIDVNKTVVFDEHSHAFIQPSTKSRAGMRKLPIILPLYKILSEYMDEIQDNQLFLAKNKNLINNSNFAYRWKKILEKINRHMPEETPTEITPHYFRHNYATDLAYTGVPIKTMQYLLGHENVNMSLNIYADIQVNWDSTTKQLDEYYDIKKYVKSMSG